MVVLSMLFWGVLPHNIDGDGPTGEHLEHPNVPNGPGPPPWPLTARTTLLAHTSTERATPHLHRRPRPEAHAALAVLFGQCLAEFVCACAHGVARVARERRGRVRPSPVARPSVQAAGTASTSQTWTARLLRALLVPSVPAALRTS